MSAPNGIRRLAVVAVFAAVAAKLWGRLSGGKDEASTSGPTRSPYDPQPRPHVEDPAHAPGKGHKGPAPEVADPIGGRARPGRNQPWVRRSHSDSQQRRFRR